jgi:hypothetical protein
MNMEQFVEGYDFFLLFTEASMVPFWSQLLRGFASSNAGVVGSNPTWGMDVCMRLFCVYAVLSVGSGLAKGWSPVQGVLSTVYRFKKLKSVKIQKGCRAIESVWSCYKVKGKVFPVLN